MRFALISDNHDTQMGLRLAGIEGVVVHDREAAEQALDAAVNDEGVAVVLITERLVQLCPERISDIKLNRARPLLVEIPDRHAEGRSSDSIMRYVREAIGIQI